MSDSGVPLEPIPDLVGRAGTAVTGKVYRHQLRPVITQGAETMNTLFAQSRPAQSAWLPVWLPKTLQHRKKAPD